MSSARRVAFCGIILLTGCAPAQLVFGTDPKIEDGLVFYDPAPHLLVTVAGDCTVTSQIVAIPGRMRSVRLKNGHGASELSLGFSNGLITSVGQKSDTKLPETIAAIGGLAGSVGGIIKGQTAQVVGAIPTSTPSSTAKTCPPQAHLYPVQGDLVNQDGDKLKGLKLDQNP